MTPSIIITAPFANIKPRTLAGAPHAVGRGSPLSEKMMSRVRRGDPVRESHPAPAPRDLGQRWLLPYPLHLAAASRAALALWLELAVALGWHLAAAPLSCPLLAAHMWLCNSGVGES